MQKSSYSESQNIWRQKFKRLLSEDNDPKINISIAFNILILNLCYSGCPKDIFIQDMSEIYDQMLEEERKLHG